MPKTLSTTAPDAVSERVDRCAQAERQNRSQVVLAAVDFWTLLSPEAHFGIGHVRLNEELWKRLARQIEQEVLDIQFAALRSRIVSSMSVPDRLGVHLADDADDNAFLDVAVDMVDGRGVSGGASY